jgi:hypothetical protein
MGRKEASAPAHACDPQQGNASLAAASEGSEFHRARTLFIIVCLL